MPLAEEVAQILREKKDENVHEQLKIYKSERTRLEAQGYKPSGPEPYSIPLDPARAQAAFTKV